MTGMTELPSFRADRQFVRLPDSHFVRLSDSQSGSLVSVCVSRLLFVLR